VITSMAQADNEMVELFRQAWEVTLGRTCDWPNTKTVDHGEHETWARWSLDYVGGSQKTLQARGQRKFSKVGLIYIIVYTPLGGGLNEPRAASEVAIAAYEGKRTPNDVWFRNVRIDSEGHGQGTGRNKSWWTTTVVAEFTYEHLR
jgi:hypothetical protein